jgi:hypothetical protein
MESCIELGEWERIGAFADRIERAFSAEALRLIVFVVDRARALVRVGQGERSPSLASKIEDLIKECREMDCITFLPALDAASRRVCQE